METKVTIEITGVDNATLAQILGLGSAKVSTAAAPAAKMATLPAAAPAPAAKPAVAAKAAPAPAAKPAVAAKAAPAPAAGVDFDQLDEDGQREAISKLITKHSKKGKTADIKALLSAYGVTRGSELTADLLPQFYSLMEQFDKGVAVEDLLAQVGEAVEDLN